MKKTKTLNLIMGEDGKLKFAKSNYTIEKTQRILKKLGVTYKPKEKKEIQKKIKKDIVIKNNYNQEIFLNYHQKYKEQSEEENNDINTEITDSTSEESESEELEVMLKDDNQINTLDIENMKINTKIKKQKQKRKNILIINRNRGETKEDRKKRQEEIKLFNKNRRINKKQRSNKFKK